MIGSSHTSTAQVTDAQTAEYLGSGALPVLATPAMIALMENAAMLALAPHLEAGQGSVGTAVSVSHTRATGVGQPIEATATITHIEGRSIEFTLTASDPYGPIGHGTHTRFIIDNAKFLAKIQK